MSGVLVSIIFIAVQIYPSLSYPLRHAITSTTGGWTLFEANSLTWYFCPSQMVLAGFYRSDCQSLACLEEMICVAPTNPAPIFSTCMNVDIGLTFDTASSVYCPYGYFVNGIRSQCQTMGCWEALYCCKYDEAVVQLYGSEQRHSWQYDFDVGRPAGLVTVGADEYISGFDRSGGTEGDDQLQNLEAAWVRKLTPSPTPYPTPYPTPRPTPKPTPKP